MKRVLACVILCLTLFALTACGGGDVGEVGILAVDSEIYTSAELESGVNTVLDYFQKEFDGCKLRELQYIGDEKNNDYLDFATRNGAEEVLVFTSTFDVDESGGDGSLNPNDTYKNWKWILARTNGGEWEHVDHGY